MHEEEREQSAHIYLCIDFAFDLESGRREYLVISWCVMWYRYAHTYTDINNSNPINDRSNNYHIQWMWQSESESEREKSVKQTI